MKTCINLGTVEVIKTNNLSSVPVSDREKQTLTEGIYQTGDGRVIVYATKPISENLREKLVRLVSKLSWIAAGKEGSLREITNETKEKLKGI